MNSKLITNNILKNFKTAKPYLEGLDEQGLRKICSHIKELNQKNQSLSRKEIKNLQKFYYFVPAKIKIALASSFRDSAPATLLRFYDPLAEDFAENFLSIDDETPYVVKVSYLCSFFVEEVKKVRIVLEKAGWKSFDNCGIHCGINDIKAEPSTKTINFDFEIYYASKEETFAIFDELIDFLVSLGLEKDFLHLECEGSESGEKFYKEFKGEKINEHISN